MMIRMELSLGNSPWTLSWILLGLLRLNIGFAAGMGIRDAYLGGRLWWLRQCTGKPRNSVDHDGDRIRQGCLYRAQSNCLELGRFIAHLIQASRAAAVLVSLPG